MGWKSESTLPYDGFEYGGGVVYNGKIHILGSTNALDDHKHYSWNGSQWVSESTLPYSFFSRNAVVYNNKIHILGTRGSGQRNHYSWDGTQWAEESTLPYPLSGQGASVVYDGKIHILGGDSVYTKIHYSWDGSQWVSESTLPYEFYEGSAIVYDGKIYILGGSYSLDWCYSWDGTEWTEETVLPVYFEDANAVVYENKLHIFGGDEVCLHYSWNGTSWTEESTMPYNFFGGSAVTYKNKIHILGGFYHLGQDYSKNHYSFRYPINKIIFGAETLVDLTADTITPGDVLLDVTFHDATGEQKVGTYEPPSVTDITPSDSSPVALEANKRYKALAAGYAIESNPSTVTPSDSSPVALTSGAIVKMGGGGYAIESNPASVTPTAAGAAFNAGINNMSTGGYAYSQRPTETETVLWTNPNTTANFAGSVDVDLSQAYTNFQKVRFYYTARTTAQVFEVYTEYKVSDIVDNWRAGTAGAGSGNYKALGTLSILAGNNIYNRYVAKDANSTTTKFRFWPAYRHSDAAAGNMYIIPTKITGVDY